MRGGAGAPGVALASRTVPRLNGRHQRRDHGVNVADLRARQGVFAQRHVHDHDLLVLTAVSTWIKRGGTVQLSDRRSGR
jgi:hypothetical protein